MASLESIASALASTVAGTTATTSTAKTYRATVNSDGTVTIDGSTTTTPATYTVSASAGDRVTVTIEGHTATVTGNITDPSASSTSVTEVSGNLAQNYYTKSETEEAISSELGSALYDSDGNLVYATTSNLTQTAEDITATFTSSVGANLLTDPGFESMAYGGTLPSGFAYSTASPNSGAYCMACTGAGTRYYFNHAYGDATDPVAITVEPGETYLYSMYYKKSSSSTAWASDNMKLRIATADGNDTLIASHSTGSIGTDWTQITGTWTNSAGYTEVYVMVATSVTSGTVYVDDAYFGPYTASGTLIRESSDGVEVAKYSGSSYSTTRTLMAADGFHVQDSGGIDLTVVDSDGMTVYADGSTAAEFTSDGMTVYASGKEAVTVGFDEDDDSYAIVKADAYTDASGLVVEEEYGSNSAQLALRDYDPDTHNAQDATLEVIQGSHYARLRLLADATGGTYSPSDVYGEVDICSSSFGGEYFNLFYLFYRSGATYSFSGVCAGYVTSSKTVITFTVPTNRSLYYVSEASASAAFSVKVRQAGNYLLGSSSSYGSISTSNLSFTIHSNCLLCTATWSSAVSDDAINNEGCSVTLSSCKVTFSA